MMLERMCSRDRLMFVIVSNNTNRLEKTIMFGLVSSDMPFRPLAQLELLERTHTLINQTDRHDRIPLGARMRMIP